MSELGPQKYSKGRYIKHNKLVIATSKPYTLSITKIVSSSKKVKNKLKLAKSAVVLTDKGLVKIINKVSHAIPLGIFVK
jgi:hypothetical protein